MGSLILNRVGFLLSNNIQSIYITEKPNQVCHLRFSNLDKKLSKNPNHKAIREWASEIDADTTLFFGFIKPNDQETLEIKLTNFEAKYFKPKYIREILIEHLRKLNFIVDHSP